VNLYYPIYVMISCSKGMRRNKIGKVTHIAKGRPFPVKQSIVNDGPFARNGSFFTSSDHIAINPNPEIVSSSLPNMNCLE